MTSDPTGGARILVFMRGQGRDKCILPENWVRVQRLLNHISHVGLPRSSPNGHTGPRQSLKVPRTLTTTTPPRVSGDPGHLQGRSLLLRNTRTPRNYPLQAEHQLNTHENLSPKKYKWIGQSENDILGLKKIINVIEELTTRRVDDLEKELFRNNRN